MAVVNMFYTAHYWVLGHLESVSRGGAVGGDIRILSSYFEFCSCFVQPGDWIEGCVILVISYHLINSRGCGVGGDIRDDLFIVTWWFNTYLFAKNNWKQIESILISISKSWKGWTHVAYYYKHSKSLGDIFCGCDMIPLHKRRSGMHFLNQMMTCRFSSQLRKKELILPIGL